MKEMLKHTLAVKYVEENEVLIVHILVLNFVIRVNAILVNIKVL
jgi:hypothetical protein